MVRRSAITLEAECTPEQRALLCGILADNRFTYRHMEIGTAAGGTLKELISVYSDRNYCPQFVVIDPMTYYEDQFEKVCTNLISAGIEPSTVLFWKGKTENFFERERGLGGKFDFIFIDADHRHFPVTADLQWADLVNVDGYICLHDRNEKFPGVGWAIDRFLKKNSNFECVDQVGSLVALKKMAEGRYPAVNANDLRAARFAQRWYKYRRKARKLSRYFSK